MVPIMDLILDPNRAPCLALDPGLGFDRFLIYFWPHLGICLWIQFRLHFCLFKYIIRYPIWDLRMTPLWYFFLWAQFFQIQFYPLSSPLRDQYPGLGSATIFISDFYPLRNPFLSPIFHHFPLKV